MRKKEERFDIYAVEVLLMQSATCRVFKNYTTPANFTASFISLK